MKKKVCMVVQNPMVKGGIAAVVNGYRGSRLEKDYDILYVESYRNGNKIQKTIKAIKGYFDFIKVLIINKPDMIHIHSSFGPSFVRSIPFIYMAKVARKHIINHIHGADFDEFYTNASNKKREIIRKVYDKCSIVIALSEEWKEKLSEIVWGEKIKVIENYSVLHEEAFKERISRPSNNTVLFLGEIGKRKGCYDIPEVIAQVVQKVSDVKFILAGSGDISEIKKLLDEKGVAENVFFPGWVRGVEKDNILRKADIFFLPSYNEGMPMSILDAMGYGLPIISTSVGAISKIVHNGDNGYVFEPGSINKFADSIVSLLKNKEKTTAYGKMSISIVKQKFSLDEHLKSLEEIYSLFI